MANLQKVVKLTKSQYNTLANGGTVGEYTGLNSNYIYLVDGDKDYEINSVYAYELTDDELREVAVFQTDGDSGTGLVLNGHLIVYGDDDAGNSQKPANVIASGSDIDTTLFNTGVCVYDNSSDHEYKISFPGKSGTFAVTSDLPQVLRFI